MIGRVIWITAIVAVAAVTAGIQLDRQARYVPTLSFSVPPPFRAFAQNHLTTSAMLGEDKQLALAEARRLVARRPMPAAHQRLLSIAEFEAGETELGGISIQRAARHGWRDPVVQQSMFQLALAAGDQAEAARRFAALFIRRSEKLSDLRAMANPLFSGDSEVARATFSQVLAGADRWHRIFLNKGARTLEPSVFLDLIQRAETQGARFDCAGLKQSARFIRTRDEAAGAALEAKIAASC
ncbi:MAG: hypothetical protein WBA51_11415 [Erythrobacter sp.]